MGNKNSNFLNNKNEDIDNNILEGIYANHKEFHEEYEKIIKKFKGIYNNIKIKLFLGQEYLCIYDETNLKLLQKIKYDDIKCWSYDKNNNFKIQTHNSIITKYIIYENNNNHIKDSIYSACELLGRFRKIP